MTGGSLGSLGDVFDPLAQATLKGIMGSTCHSQFFPAVVQRLGGTLKKYILEEAGQEL